MNIVISIFAVYFALKLIKKQVVISRSSRFLIYLGICLPAVDYLLRFTVGEIWFQTNGLIFHSLIYHSLFWGTVTLLTWVYLRNAGKAARLLLPLVGLLIYALFTVLSMENLSFLAPFSDVTFNLGWITPGYLVPLAILTVLRLTLLGSELSETLVCSLAVASLLLFVAYAGISFHRISADLAETFPEAYVVSIAPVNHQQTLWRVVMQHQDSYTHTRFHFVQGPDNDIEEKAMVNNSEIAQAALQDPDVRQLFLNAFRNPVIQVDIQNESMLISISELVSLIEPVWVKQIQMRKNKSGQMVQFDVEYGTIL